jgi:hypothetical protein
MSFLAMAILAFSFLWFSCFFIEMTLGCNFEDNGWIANHMWMPNTVTEVNT